MIVNEQKPIVFDNKCHAIFCADDLKEAILQKTTKPVCRVKAIYIYGHYPAISIHGEKYHIHRLIAEYKLGGALGRSESAHHSDGNPLNALWENINIMRQGDHVRHHLAGKKQDPEFARRRTNASCIAKYGHAIHDPELLEKK